MKHSNNISGVQPPTNYFSQPNRVGKSSISSTIVEKIKTWLQVLVTDSNNIEVIKQFLDRKLLLDNKYLLRV